MYKSILLAADGSENSLRSAQEVLNFIDENTIVTLITVVNVEESKTDVLHGKQGHSLTNEREDKLSSITELFVEHNVNYEVKLHMVFLQKQWFQLLIVVNIKQLF